MTPTKEQIDAEMALAKKIAWEMDSHRYLATALATARLEGEARGRNKALDEAAAEIEAAGYFRYGPSSDEAEICDSQIDYFKAAILALKEKTNDTD